MISSAFRQSIVAVSRKIIFPVVLILLYISLQAQETGHIRVIKKELQSPADIMPVTGKEVIPYVYSNTVSLNNLPVTEKKQKFFDMLLPSVLVAKTNLDMTRKRVEALALKKTMTPADTNFLLPLMKKYDTHDIHELIKRLQTFPVSIILAQAAIESGWGTSRFFKEGNNIFGMWSFDSSENRMPSLSSRNGKHIYLQKFNNLEQAIEAYMFMLDTRQPFATFRTMRSKTKDPLILVDSLKMYSERGTRYIDALAQIIRANHLQQYDSCRIASQYLIN
jgi:Bax protein